jgi:tryptophanyl-tRNA synthetase
MGQEYDGLMANPEVIDEMLAKGAERARPIAAATVKRARKAAGIDS